MHRHRHLRYFLVIGLVFLLAGLLWAQRGPDRTLVVNGKTMGSPIVQIGGRSYVDLETLAQITNGVIAVQPASAGRVGGSQFPNSHADGFPVILVGRGRPFPAERCIRHGTHG